MDNTDLVRVRHMIDAAKEAVEFCDGKTRSDLESDRKLPLAFLKELEIIGEAATKVTEETRRQWPGIPWEDIVGMRNKNGPAFDGAVLLTKLDDEEIDRTR